MNKKSFVKEYRKSLLSKGGLKTFIEAEKDIEIFLEALKVGLVREGEIKLQNKGKFTVLQKKERVISNPATKERMTIIPPKTIKFTVSGKILKRINEISK
ncbi:HU family DNA-binding protein [Fusobacterium sp.]|uniref:HU family DNA-binding protein n=1 Tax=Fusobacterium sp. TaxID=68766 RepID=UPI00290128BE|nr:HU family DNA-binding protein [Fusobacterium sp.]MDU1911986.1 HU family DNA-binding protein [Fusobacterium sp.]